jgi:iron complex outermembrane recepter protein
MDKKIPRRPFVRRCALLLALTVAGPSIGPAVVHAEQGGAAVDLRLASLEELMDIEIVSASKKKERVGDAAAAIDVLTSEDIRRSGLTTLPELMRLLPGVQVAQIDSHNWAIAIRGFNDLYTNKLLVLIDGRSRYTRVFSGVAWSWQNLLLEDIERIELIRGPVAATWGANAVTGVINIVTKHTDDTRGGYVVAEGGGLGTRQAAARYGGRRGNLGYRLFSQWNDHGTQRTAENRSAQDDWQRVLNGARLDWTRGTDTVTVDGDVTFGDTHNQGLVLESPTPIRPGQPTRDFKDTFGYGHAMGRWTHTRSNGDAWEVASYFDMGQETAPVWKYDRKAFDIDAQYHGRFASRHDVVFGTGYRVEDEQLRGSFSYSVGGPVPTLMLFSAFGQDEISLAKNRVRVTVGARLEHDTFAKWGVQPTLRTVWDITPGQHLWGAVSRALRTPSIHDRYLETNFYSYYDPRTGLPVVLQLIGNQTFETERVKSAEMGYRVEIGTRASLSASAFFADYPNLMSYETLPYSVRYAPSLHVAVPIQFQNLYAAETSGVELSGHMMPAAGWRVDVSYTGFHLTSKPDPRSNSEGAAGYDGNAPSSSWTVRSLFTPTSRIELDAAMFRVGALRQIEVPAYTRVDARAQYALSRRVAVSVAGQNLFDRSHYEFGGYEQSNYAPRTGSVRMTWRF